MTWLAWRQLRTPALLLALVVAGVAVAFAVSGPHLVHLWHLDASGFLRRIAGEGSTRAMFMFGTFAVLMAPAILGAFLGAPIVARELEAGTHRLVWTQSLTRRRWLSGRMAMAGAVATAVAAALVVIVMWWTDPIEDALRQGVQPAGLFTVARMHPVIFSTRGIVPVAMTALALVIGVAAGLAIRRTVPAIVLTLVVVAGLQFLMADVVRAHLATPATRTAAITADTFAGMSARMPQDGGTPTQVEELFVQGGNPTDWVLSNYTVDRTGKAVSTLPGWVADCGGPPPNGEQTAPDAVQQARDACFSRLATEGYRQKVVAFSYGSFWTLQWRESGVLLGLAALVGGWCFRRIRRDVG